MFDLPHLVVYTERGDRHPRCGGVGIWNAVLAALGWYLEAIVPEDQLISTVTEYSHEIGYVIIALVALALGYVIYKGVKK